MEEQKRNPAQGLSESEQVQVRRQKLADLQAAGNDPFTLTKFPQDAYSADLKEEFKDLLLNFKPFDFTSIQFNIKACSIPLIHGSCLWFICIIDNTETVCRRIYVDIHIVVVGIPAFHFFFFVCCKENSTIQ